MTTNSSVGTTLKISASLPAVNNGAGYAALPFTQIGEITDLEMPVREYEVKTHYPLTQRGAVKRKGNYNDGRMVVTLAVDDFDAGQILATQAVDSDAYYSFKVSMPVRGAQFFKAQVMSFSTNVGSSNDIVTGVIVLEVDSEAGVISVADESLIWAFDADTLSLVPTEGSGTPTFARSAATATRFNSLGPIEVVAADMPRFDYDPVTLALKGLLWEDARTQVALWNRDLTNAAWVKTNVTAAKNQIGLDGVSNSASSIVATAGNGTCLQAITLASSARFQTTYVKRLVGTGTIEMTMDNGTTWTAITTTAAWTRVSIPTQTLANPTVGFRIVTSGDSIAVDYVQNEDGVFATSAIPTTTAAVTRNADVSLLAPSAIPGFSETALTIFVEGYAASGHDGSTAQNAVYIGGGSAADEHKIYRSVGANAPRARTRAASITQADIDAGTWNHGALARMAYAVTVNDGAACIDGGTVQTDGSITMPVGLTTIRIGSTQTGVNQFNGHIRKVRIYNRRLSNTELQSLTTTGELP